MAVHGHAPISLTRVQARFPQAASILGRAPTLHLNEIVLVDTKSRKPEPIPREPSLLSLGVAAPSSPRQVLVNETWYYG